MYVAEQTLLSIYKSKLGCKDQESIQSGITPEPGLWLQYIRRQYFMTRQSPRTLALNIVGVQVILKIRG